MQPKLTKGVQITVDTVDHEIDEQIKLAKLSNDLMGGQRTMEKAGAEYIDQGTDEDVNDFQLRVKRAKLFPAYKKTVEHLKGQVFQKDVTIGEETDEIMQWRDDVDNKGNNLTQWSKEAFEKALVNGTCFALVEYSNVETMTDSNGNLFYNDNGEWKPKTAEADKNNAWRPYLLLIPVQNVVKLRTDSRNGRDVITMFAYKETSYVSDGTEFGRELLEQIRVYKENGDWELWQKKEGETNYTRHSEGHLSINTIPLAVCKLGEELTPYTATPTLDDLAQIAKKYWVRSSSYYTLMEFNDRPVYFSTGVSGQNYDINHATGETIPVVRTIQAGAYIDVSNSQATMQSIGVDSNSVTNSQADLETLKDEMAMYGMQLLQKPQVSQTATESKIDDKESHSTLKGWALTFEDFLNHVMYYLGLWLEQDLSQMKVEVNKEFSTPRDKAFLFSLRRSGDISQELFLREMVAIGELPEDMDVEEEIQKNKNEQRLLSMPTNPTAKSLTDRLNNA